MVVLGVDPGTATTGYGLVKGEGERLSVVDYGCIYTEPNLPTPERLEKIYLDVVELIRRHRPWDLAVEEVFFNRNAKTAIAVGQARGVVMLAAAACGVSVAEYTPLEVKQAITGYGKATKPQMQRMVRLILGLDEDPSPDDAADALAIAICHIHFMKVDARLKGERR